MIMNNGHAPEAQSVDLSLGGAGGFCVDLAAGHGAGAALSAEPDYLRHAWAEGEIGGEGAACGINGCGGGMASSVWIGGRFVGKSAQDAGWGAFDFQFHRQRR